jgi:hypothetical protein
MNTTLFPLIALFLSILSASCTKEVGYTKESMIKLAQVGDPSASLILPKTMNDGVSCSDYSAGCMSAHIVRVKKLDFIMVEFKTKDQAIYAAKKFRGYYSNNWMLDDVTGEPLLENFVIKYLEAKKP